MSLARRLWNTLRPARVQRDIDRELSFHLAERVDQLRADGLSGEEAVRRARIQFGYPILQRERTRDMDIAEWLDASFRNVRYAVRSLVRTPGFTTTVVLTLALGIGANSAVFSAIDGVLLRPLPFPDGDRLVQLMQIQRGSVATGIAPSRLLDWNRLNNTFDGISGYYVDDVVDTSRELPERFRRALVAPGFFDVLRVGPAQGRTFGPADHRYGGVITFLISDRRWHGLGADPGVLTRTFKLGNASLQTVGIMPASFQFPTKDIDMWSSDDIDAPWALSRTLTWYTGIGRLKPGVTIEQVRADLERVQTTLGEQFPDTDRTIGVRIVPLKDTLVSGTRASLWVLYGAVSLLLLIACTNIAALLLSRAARREGEIAVRYSLGASRAMVAAQLLTETAVLACAGAAVGLVVAIGASRALRLLAPELPRVNEITIDLRILLYMIASTVIVALLCGLVPAIRSSRSTRSVSRSTRTTTSTRHSLQWFLVSVQIALSVTLLAGAGLLIRSIDALTRVDSGFDPSRVLTLRVSGQYGSETSDAAVQRINRVLDGLEALPDVETAAITSTLPGVREQQSQEFQLIEGRIDASLRVIAENRIVSPGYFATMGIPIVTGDLCRRPPDAGGRKGVVTEVMVNRRFAHRYLQGTPVIGLHLVGGLDAMARNGHLFGTPPPPRIVGIVADARELGADREPAPTVYTCFSFPSPAPWHVIRTAGDPMAAALAIRRRIRELEPQRSVDDIAPLEQRMDSAYAQNRLRTWLLSAFAMTALVLVCAGVFGTLSYAVSLRRREVALRLALGALRRSVVQQLIGTSVRIVGAASACGLVLALIFTQSLTTMLYGVTPADPVTLAGVIVLVVTVACIAAVIPAARAAFVQPMRALREE